MAVPKNLRGLIGGKVRENIICENWTDVLRVAVTMETGDMPPSQIMRTLASYPRQNALAVALREIGRIERTLFIARWLTDSDLGVDSGRGQDDTLRVRLHKGTKPTTGFSYV